MSTCPQCGTVYPAAVRICTQDGTVLEAESGADPRLGTVLDGKYRLETRLGAGGMGAVYKATHLMLGKAVAVKLIKPELVTSPELVRRFQREARAASTLAHPNIAAAYDLGQTTDGTLYIAMEFIDGPSLKDVIRSSGQIEPARIIRLLRQVGSALALAHRHDVVHRDLKPHNIALATDDRGHEVAKLLDFGIAKTFDEATQLTATGFALGTPQYMSPEQAAGRPVDGRSDIYALGIILYEMLVGQVPFNDPSTPAVLVKHMTEVPEHPSRRRPDLDISPTLEAVALRCLEKEPAARFQTMDEFMAALESTTAAHQVPAETATVILPAAAAAEASAATTRMGAARTADPVPAIAATTRAKHPVAAPPASSSPVPVPPLSAPGARAMAAEAPVRLHDRRAISPKTVVAAAIVVAVIGGGVLYGLVVLRAPREDATPQAAASVPTQSVAATDTPASTPPTASDPGPGASSAEGGTGDAGAAASAIAPISAAPGGQSNDRAAITGATVSSASVAQAGATRPAAAAASAPPAPARAEVPTVAFRCTGSDEICPTIRSAVEALLRERAMPVTRDPARADIVVDARVTFGGEKASQLFGQTMVVATYTTDVEAEDVKTRDAVAMIPPATVSFDNRYRAERLGDHSRLIAAGVADSVSEYWKK